MQTGRLRRSFHHLCTKPEVCSSIQTILLVPELHRVSRRSGSRTLPPVGNFTLPRKTSWLLNCMSIIFRPGHSVKGKPAKSRAAQKGPDGGRYRVPPIAGGEQYSTFRAHWSTAGTAPFTQATVMAAYLSEPITFSMASTGFIPTHCIT